jgi:rhodanese-related sulfurtransferase
MRFRAQGLSGLDVAAVGELIDGGQAFVLDVREDVEWAAGHIPAATHIPITQVGARLHELPKNAGIVTICRSGNRSGAVATELARRGYRVRNLSGGMVAWHAAGAPMEPAGASVA